MKLEINLVKTQTLDASVGKLMSRQRVEVDSEQVVMGALVDFLKQEASTLSTVITDQRLITKLQGLSNITITEFQCLRYMLASKGFDIWCWIVSDSEINPNEIEDQIFEYNVVDSNSISGSFVPKSSKIIQSSSNNSLTELYTKINDGFTLFTGDLFIGMNNPIINTVTTMKESETALGITSKAQTTYVNSVLEYLGIRVKVLMN
jgi:hypothetical protein